MKTFGQSKKKYKNVSVLLSISDNKIHFVQIHDEIFKPRTKKSTTQNYKISSISNIFEILISADSRAHSGSKINCTGDNISLYETVSLICAENHTVNHTTDLSYTP